MKIIVTIGKDSFQAFSIEAAIILCLEKNTQHTYPNHVPMQIADEDGEVFWGSHQGDPSVHDQIESLENTRSRALITDEDVREIYARSLHSFFAQRWDNHIQTIEK